MIFNWKKILGYSFLLSLLTSLFIIIFSDGPVEYFLNDFPSLNMMGMNFSLVPPLAFLFLALILFLIDKNEKRVDRLMNSFNFLFLSIFFYFLLLPTFIYGWIFFLMFLGGGKSF